MSALDVLAAVAFAATLMATCIVASYAWLATRHLRTNERLRLVVRTLAEAPRLLAMDRRDRGDFLRYFYRRFEDVQDFVHELEPMLAKDLANDTPPDDDQDD